MKNKKAIATFELFHFLIIGFVILLVVGLFVYMFNLVTTSLDMDLMVGAVNLSQVTQSTIGQINTAILTKINTFGIFILFGMVLGMLINAYFTRDEYPSLFLIIDLMLIIFAYILSVYLSNSYEMIISTEPFRDIFVTNLSLSSKFLLNLPLISVVVGILIMIITYTKIPLRKEEVMMGR